MTDASSQLTLSLVVCTLERPHCVERLLKATLAGERVPDEIIIVDASGAAGYADLADRLAALSADVVQHLPVADHERGLTRQRNVGIKASAGRYIAFLDDDCVPESGYFAELVAAAERHPGAVGIGGWLDEGQWRRVAAGTQVSAASDVLGSTLVVGGWRRLVGVRWRVRQRLGLAPPLEPGRVPAQGHGWPVSYLAPNSDDVAVDCFMGGASLWRRELFEVTGFSNWFEGYGLYEDQDFCLRARGHGQLIVTPAARVRHLHEPSGRPQPFRYGRMVLVNGWKVWRLANPRPRLKDRWRWWLVSGLLMLVRVGNAVRGPGRAASLLEALGRCWGGASVLILPPALGETIDAPLADRSGVRASRSSGDAA